MEALVWACFLCRYVIVPHIRFYEAVCSGEVDPLLTYFTDEMPVTVM